MIKKLLLLSFSMLFVSAAFSQTDRYWVTGGDGNWNSTSNWSDASGGASGFTVPNANTFRVIFDANSGSPTVNLGSIITVGQLQVVGNQLVTLSAGAVFTLSVGNNYAGVDFLVETGSALNVGTNSNLTLLGNNTATIDGELIINPGRTFTTNAVGAVSTVNGTISNSGTVTGSAVGLIFAAGGNYNHNQNGGVIPTASRNAASNVNILGIIDTAPTGIAQTFGNLTWNAAGQTAAVNINAAPTAINGTFRIQNTNGQVVRLTGGVGAGVTWNVVNFLQNDGTLELSSNGNNGILIISGTFTQSGGSIIKTGASAGSEIRFTGATDVSPVINGTITGVLATPLIFNANKTAPARVVLPANASFDATEQLRVTTGILDLGTATSTVTVNGPFNLLAGGTIDMSGNADHIFDLKGVITYAAGGALISGGNNQEVRYSGAAQNVMPFTYRNLLIDGTATKTMVGAITVNNNLSIQGTATLLTNAFQISGNATGTLSVGATAILQLGSTGAATDILFPTNFISGNILLNPTSTVTYHNNATQTVSDTPVYGNLNIATGGTKTLAGSNATVNIAGNLTITGGTFNLGTSATAVNILGNATVTGALTFGTTVKTVSLLGNLSGAGTINMNGAGLAHIFNLSGATNAITTFNTTDASGSTVNYNRSDNQTVFVTINYQNLNLLGSGIKTLGAGTNTIRGNLNISDATMAFNAAIQTTNVLGNLSGNGTIDMSPGNFAHVLNLGGVDNAIGNLTTAAAASVVSYNRVGDQNLFTSTNYRNLTLAGGGNKALQGNASVSGTLTLTSGRLILGVNSITLTGIAAVAGASAANYIVADGAGQLRKVFAAGATLAYVLPIGDVAGYSPVSLAYTTNSTQRTIGVRVTDAQHPSDGTSNDYITRYWSFTDDQAGTYTYTALFTHLGAPADLVGTNGNMRVNRWDGSNWTQYTSTWPSGTTIQAAGITEANGPLNNSEFTGRVNIATYTWNRTDDTGDWQVAANWNPARLNPQLTDIIIFNSNGTTTATNVPTQTIARLVVSGNSNVSLVSQTGAARTLTIGSASGTNLDIQSGSTLQLSSTGADQIILAFAPATQTATVDGTIVINPNGALSNTFSATNSSTTVNGTFVNNGGNVTSTAANLSFGPSGNYNHSRDGGVIPTATWNVAANVNILGTLAVTPTGIAQTFGNFIWNATGQTGAVNINAAPTAINGTFRIQNTNGQVVRLTGGAGGAATWNVVNFLQNDGTLELSGNANNGILNVSGTFTQTGGSIIKTGTSAGSEIRFTGATDVSPVINGTITGLLATPLFFNTQKTAPAKVILPTNQIFDATVQVRITSGTLDLGAATSTVVVNGNLVMAAAAATVDMSGNTDHKLYLRGATNTFTAGGTFTAGAENQTVYYDGDVAQTMMPVTYNHLEVANFNLASATARIKSLAGTTTINGNLNIQGVDATPTVTLQLGGNNLTVNGQTSINAFGILNDNALAGTNLFVGQVAINANGRWLTANNPPFTFRGGLAYNGAQFTSGTGLYTFNTNSQFISGNQSLTITNIVTTDATLTNRHTAGLTVSVISGNGAFTNGDVGFNAILYVTAANPFTLTGALDLATNPNTVDYSTTIAQTIGPYNFYNLSTSGARTTNNITLVSGGTIGIASSLNPAATFTTGNYIRTNNTVDFNGTTDQPVTALRPTNPYNNLTVSGGSTKTLSSAVSVSNVLNLNGGVLELDDYSLTITNNAVDAIQGAFGSTNMISTNGAGRLVKNAASLQQLYPIGSGGYYSPMTLTAIAPTTGTLNVLANPTALNPSYINKYWDITTSVIRTSATATFQYDVAELNGASQQISYSSTGGSTWENPPLTGTQSFGANSFTITGTNPFAGWWTMGYKTFYSFQTGSWNNPTTWTTDPSGTLQIGTTIPDYNDKVVILTGRTVSLTSDIATQNLDITINDGGFLNMASYQFANGLLGLRGQGTLKLASDYFPTAVTNTLVIAGGGTVEYNASINLPAIPATYNNLTINTAGSVVQLNNKTLFGNLNIAQGNYQINDNTPTRLQLIVNGNLTVASTGGISVGNGVTNTTTNPIGINGGAAPFLNYYDQQSHRVVIYGDFSNEGTVRFTNLNFPIYDQFPATTLDATTGFATVYFLGNTSNVLNCEGVTDFYNLVVDKGTDQTFSLTINSTDYANFKLFGANVAPGENPGNNPFMKKALWVRSGTLVLDGYIAIPSLTEGTDGVSAVTSDFYIPTNAALVVSDANVVLLVTADDYQDVNAAYAVSGGTGLVNGVTQGIGNALQVLGKLEVAEGYLSTRESAGILYSNANAGQVIISGGKVDAKQFRPIGAGLVSYSQSGGELMLRGRIQRTPLAYDSPDDLVNAPLNTARANDAILRSDVGTFSINNALGVFAMTGGTISIYDAPDDVSGRTFDIFSSPSNYNVTAGTVAFLPIEGTGLANASTWLVSSNAPLGNITINRASSSTVVGLETGYPLTVLRNFTLQSGEFNTNNLNVFIGGNFTHQAGTTYTPGTGITTLNGTIPQTFTINLATPLELNALTISKAAGSAVTFAGSQKTLNVNGNFRLENGTLNDNGNTINLLANVYNSGVHNGIGKIVLNSDAAQTLDGDGTGIFRNIEFNKPTDGAVNVLATNRFTINGALTFSGSAAGYKRLNMQSFNLALGASATVVGADENRYVLFDGNFGDGGITKTYSVTSTSFTFPLATVHPTVNYTPATISIGTAPTGWGSITVTPVKIEHPNTTTKNISLKYFWKVRSTGFTGLPASAVTHSYTYSQDDVVADEAEYIPARYDQSSTLWSAGTTASVDETNNIIGAPWLTNTDFIDGDYTAGDADPTSPFGAPTTYYSRQGGLWDDVNTWSLTNLNNHNPADNLVAGAIPDASDIVIIGGNDSIFLFNEVPPLPINNTDPAVTYYQLNKTIVNSASLQIESGSVLDIQNNPGSNFGVVISHPNGNGKLRVTTRHPAVFDQYSTFVFPAGDFSDFNENAGITEFYTVNPQSGTWYMLPTEVNTYGTVILNPLRGSNIIFPNISLVNILGDLICRGSDADAWLAMTWVSVGPPYGNYPTPIVPKTVNVARDFLIEGGSFIFIGNSTIQQTLNVGRDLYVAPNAALYAWTFGTASTANTITIGRNLTNNSNNTTAPNGTVSMIDLRRGGSTADILFTGPNSGFLTNTSSTPTTRLNRVTVNKGTSLATSLTVNISGTLDHLTDNWLTLQSGTLVYQRTGNFNISTTTPFTIEAPAGLTVNTPSSVFIGNANSNVSDLILNGRLTLINGTVNVGPIGAPNNNNDIEYSGGGSSALDIRGGSLFVNGQIRRNTSTTAGILNYTQSGGTVLINGNNHFAANAKLEVLNPGSRFNMSGGTLTIVRGGGTTFGDLYLRPTLSTVTGGEIIFSQGGIDAAQTYRLDANVALNNLTITGKTTPTVRNATVTLMVSPLVLKGSLTISNIQSFFNTNNRNVTIGGNLVNSGAYTFGANTTTFNGGAQSITGTTVTNFNNLVVSPVTTLTVNNNFNIGGSLTIGSGNLILNNLRVTVIGNLVNNGSYTDDNTVGGLRLAGTVQQQVSGTGSFGRLEINNPQGARINNDITLQNDLVMTQGNIDINQRLLSLGQNSNLLGAPFSQTKMIFSQGVASNLGLRKFFGITAVPVSFTFPVGVSGKYTPVELTLNQNSSVGYIGVNPVNNNHPAIIIPTNVLKYYWKVESAGISNIEGNMLMKYLDADVYGIEDDYIAAFLLAPGAYWSKAQPGETTDNVDEANNLISYSISSGTNNVTGDYTAVTDGDLPDEVPSYITISDGNWSDETIWAPLGSSPPCPVGGPNGFNVTIEHEVTTNVNYCFAYRTTINGKLKVVSPTFGHNIGAVEGSGTLYLENGNLPAGIFDIFLDCSSPGALEYGGTGNYTILASQFNSVPNIFFTGSGTRTLPNKDLTICNRLVIDGPSLDNNTYKKKLTLLGTMERYNTGTFIAGTGATSIVSFAGTNPQTLGGGTGDFTGTNRFNNLEINNPNGLSIGNNGVIEIGSSLILTNGVINTTATNRLIIVNTSAAAVSPIGGSSTSYVSGPLSKRIANGGSFVYPLGKNVTKGHPFTVTSAAGSNQYFIAEFFTPNATFNALTAPLESSNSGEYWNVTTTINRLARVRVGWDTESDLTPAMTQNGLIDMRVAEYNTGTSRWVEQASTATGTAALGDVGTTNNITITPTGKQFTSASVTTTKPRAAFNPSGAVCGTAGIPVRFTSFSPINLNYTLDYTIDGVDQPTITVTSLPYVLPTPTPGAYQLTGFTYNSGAGTDAVVSSSVVNVSPVPTVALAGPDQSLCGVSGVTLAGNNPAPFTGLWTIRSGSGGLLLSPTSYNSVFNGQLGNTYVLRWTISSGGCTSWDEVTISFPVAAAMPSNFSTGPTTVCQGATVTYTVPAAASTTYTWSYSGTGANINGLGNPVAGIGNSVTVAFSPTATSGVISVTATNACGTSPARTRNVTVTPLPDAAGLISGSAVVCQGENGVAFDVPAIANATGYVWTLPTGATIATGANTNSITVNFSASASSGNITVRGTNSCGSGVVSSNFAVTVNPMPTITLGSNPSVCRGTSPAQLFYTATTHSPDQYSIAFDVAATAQGFVDVSNAPLGMGSISIATPLAAAAGTYNAILMVRNSVTGCLSPNYNISITVLPLPTSLITGLLTSAIICEGEDVQMTIDLSGQPPFTFTIQDNHGGSWVVNTLNTSYTFAVPVPDRPIWISPDLPTIYKYTILLMSDDNGCDDVAPAGEVEVSVYKIPETGPAHHIPNTNNM